MASTIFTASDWYDLSSAQYGAMFVPQVITAVTTSLLGTTLSSRFGSKRVYVAGLAAAFHRDAVDQSVLVLNALLGLPAIFAASAVVAIVMGALSFLVAFRRPSPTSLHPRPAPAAVVSA